jgi:hippurate hydrolase
MTVRPRLLLAPLLLLATKSAAAAPTTPAAVDALYPDLDKLYQDLHQSPELSDHEEMTANKLADRLRALGYEVTTHVGGFGVVGLLKNGAGPTVMIRTDLDALPVEEKSGLPYASKVTTKDDSGETVHVMHACGHDVHMTVWVGTAAMLAKQRDKWHGTVMMVGQPAEEKGAGARRMLKDGLFQRFAQPTYAIALHDSADLPAGKVTVVPGYALANTDSVDMIVIGRGGHGSTPHLSIDPIVLGARIVLALQTIVSRENAPIDPAVITVGSFQSGTRPNIIPDEAHLQITVRSYKDEVRKRLLSAIQRVAKGEAMSAGAPEPKITIAPGTPSTYNDPDLSQRVERTLKEVVGAENVLPGLPVMGGEDFSQYGRAGVPSVMFWLGAVDPKKHREAEAQKTTLPPLHSSIFAPDRTPTIKTGVRAMTGVALDLLGK